jgi:hypothetical protein
VRHSFRPLSAGGDPQRDVLTKTRAKSSLHL